MPGWGINRTRNGETTADYERMGAKIKPPSPTPPPAEPSTSAARLDDGQRPPAVLTAAPAATVPAGVVAPATAGALQPRGSAEVRVAVQRYVDKMTTLTGNGTPHHFVVAFDRLRGELRAAGFAFLDNGPQQAAYRSLRDLRDREAVASSLFDGGPVPRPVMAQAVETARAIEAAA